MPKSVKNQYTQKQFEKDLSQLELLVKNNSKKGGKLLENGESQVSQLYQEQENEEEELTHVVNGNGNASGNMNASEKSNGNSNRNANGKVRGNANGKVRGNANRNTSGNTDNGISGGKKELYEGTYRHFKMVEVDGKPVKTNARADIKEHQSPLNAAKKLLTSMVKKDKLSDNAKSKLSVIFYIQETNRESKSKIYGPYIGKYHKYTPSEAAKASADEGKVFFKFKPMVRLYKGSSKKEQKGGKKM